MANLNIQQKVEVLNLAVKCVREPIRKSNTDYDMGGEIVRLYRLLRSVLQGEPHEFVCCKLNCACICPEGAPCVHRSKWLKREP